MFTSTTCKIFVWHTLCAYVVILFCTFSKGRFCRRWYRQSFVYCMFMSTTCKIFVWHTLCAFVVILFCTFLEWDGFVVRLPIGVMCFVLRAPTACCKVIDKVFDLRRRPRGCTMRIHICKGERVVLPTNPIPVVFSSFHQSPRISSCSSKYLNISRNCRTSSHRRECDLAIAAIISYCQRSSKSRSTDDAITRVSSDEFIEYDWSSSSTSASSASFLTLRGLSCCCCCCCSSPSFSEESSSLLLRLSWTIIWNTRCTGLCHLPCQRRRMCAWHTAHMLYILTNSHYVLTRDCMNRINLHYCRVNNAHMSAKRTIMPARSTYGCQTRLPKNS